ncbi:transcriptional regulator [Paenibacillus rhizovicinus]|uniref:Transcriptional regulator n=1 Tax=Paenibacillus rhizovicinus TaxID=2704463 RepID=A0A6C0P3W0_9BACL|nr:PLDc N-terminal domain-containing protein [Paenibacillus rhizovicinus]QHW33125.1 transcriptional regulator [Paenibacillus rhizovicinus]
MDQLSTSQLVSILVPLGIVELVLMITAIVACVRAERTRGPKWLWILIIIVFNLIGSIVFFVAGRKSS